MYHLFVGDNYYPKAFAGDYEDSFTAVADCKQHILDNWADMEGTSWYSIHIVNSAGKLEVIEKGVIEVVYSDGWNPEEIILTPREE